jgi:protein TonB
MQVKKTQKADLESKKSIFMQIGLVFALVVTLAAFEWKVDSSKVDTIEAVAEAAADEELAQITTQAPPPPPPPPPAPQVSDVLSIAESDDDFDDELEIEDVEADVDAEVEIVDIEEDIEEGESQIFVRAETMPSFPGGLKAMYKFLGKRTKYPTIALENGIQGRVFVGFVVDKDGSITNVKILRPVDPYLDKEALRVVKSMPKWSPGRQGSKTVRVSYTVPVNFTLK